MPNDVVVSLSNELADDIQRRAEATGFNDIDSYIEYVLSEVIHQLDDVDASESIDESEVKDRLETLGYLE